MTKLPSHAETKLNSLCQRGYISLRKPPTSCICPLCPTQNADESGDKKTLESKKVKTFTGVSAWEARMEHMATAHMCPARRNSAASAPVEVPPPAEWAKDANLEKWLLSEELAEINEQGVWKCRGVRGNGHQHDG